MMDGGKARLVCGWREGGMHVCMNVQMHACMNVAMLMRVKTSNLI